MIAKESNKEALIKDINKMPLWMKRLIKPMTHN